VGHRGDVSRAEWRGGTAADAPRDPSGLADALVQVSLPDAQRLGERGDRVAARVSHTVDRVISRTLRRTGRSWASGMAAEVISVLRAVWNGRVLAESENTVQVEGNRYFPPASLRREYFTVSRSRSVCPWKGIARYYTLEVDGMVNRNAAWYYPHPSPLARRIKNHVAFWKGVRIEEVSAR